MDSAGADFEGKGGSARWIVGRGPSLHGGYNTDNGVISMHPVPDLDTYFGHSEEAIAEVVDFDIWSSRRKISGHNIDEGRGFTGTPMRRLVLCRVLAIASMHLVNIMFSRWCPLYPHRRLQDF